MDDPLKPGNGGDAPAGENSPEDQLSELRGLLLAADEAEVVQLRDRLEDPRSRAEDISLVLPEAIVIRSQADRELTDALMPTVEEAIVRSARKDPEVLVDALFPVMGPAIRKAITSTLAGMLESLNQTLVRGFSAQGLKWRLEAWRTGKSFSEVVLLRTLVYRVEQVFLIHRKSGLLLQHVSAGAAGVQDADMISGMLTAIRDFVQDSFGATATDGLDAFQVGAFTVWVEQGPQAVLAAVIRGNPPRQLRSVFAEALETIHRRQARALDEFEGDASPFERSRDDLEACLKTQQQPGTGETTPGRRRHGPLWASLAVLLALLGLWTFFSVRRSRRWDTYLERLAAQPGIVVSAAGRRNGKFFVSGLRDPFAVDPAALLAPAKLRPEDVVSLWKPYQGLEPALVAARERALLDTNRKNLESARARLETQRILFARGSSELAENELARLSDAAREIDRLPALAAAAGSEIRVEIVGRGDSEGTSETNLALSRRRAERVLAALRTEGLPTWSVAAVGVGAAQPLAPERTEEEKQLNRSVSFRVVPGAARPVEAAAR